jgi:hypothetical protein
MDSGLIPEEQELADALLLIAKKYGKFNDDNTGIWAGYTPASENEENAKIGVKCGSCVFFNAPNGCSIIVSAVEEGGLCRFAVLPDGAVTATAGSKPAPKKDRIKGSDKNKKGSADTGASVKFTEAITKALEKKVEDHNAKAKNGRKVNMRMLKAVYRRGAGAFSTSHRPDQNRNSWAMARVNAFLKLVRSGKPTNSKYVSDNDLLPKTHPRSTEASTMSPLVASMFAALDEDECPPATQDIELNLKNRQNAIDNVGYGPLNPKEPNDEFWQDKADKLNTTVQEARTTTCATCVFFVRTPEMLDCISSGIEQGGSSVGDADSAIDQAELGYCEALDFKCAASRTCNAWAVGGPIE